MQAVYERTGQPTPSGMHATRLRAIHDVAAHGEATQDQYGPERMTDLLEFGLQARKGMPPTSSQRWCTSYFKISLYAAWARHNRARPGPRPVLITGERWLERTNRSRLPGWQWRDDVELAPGNVDYPYGWRMLWLRPTAAWRWHEVNQYVAAHGVPFHPGSFAQGATLAALRDPHRDERQGRARRSGMACSFSHPRDMARALSNAPALMEPAVARVAAYEATSGSTWQQRGPIRSLVQPRHAASKARQQAWC